MSYNRYSSSSASSGYGSSYKNPNINKYAGNKNTNTQQKKQPKPPKQKQQKHGERELFSILYNLAPVVYQKLSNSETEITKELVDKEIDVMLLIAESITDKYLVTDDQRKKKATSASYYKA